MHLKIWNILLKVGLVSLLLINFIAPPLNIFAEQICETGAVVRNPITGVYSCTSSIDSIGAYPSITSGVYGQAFSFPSSKYFSIAEQKLGTAYTISTWLNFSDKPNNGGGWWTVVARSGGTYHHIIINQSSGEIGVYNGNWFTSGYSINSLTGWHHVAMVSNGSVNKLYIDGSQVGSDINTVIDTNGAPISILGNYAVNGGQNSMDMDETAIFNRALASYEVSTLSNSQVLNSGVSGSVFYSSMDSSSLPFQDTKVNQGIGDNYQTLNIATFTINSITSLGKVNIGVGTGWTDLAISNFSLSNGDGNLVSIGATLTSFESISIPNTSGFNAIVIGNHLVSIGANSSSFDSISIPDTSGYIAIAPVGSADPNAEVPVTNTDPTFGSQFTLCKVSEIRKSSFGSIYCSPGISESAFNALTDKSEYDQGNYIDIGQNGDNSVSLITFSDPSSQQNEGLIDLGQVGYNQITLIAFSDGTLQNEGLVDLGVKGYTDVNTISFNFIMLNQNGGLVDLGSSITPIVVSDLNAQDFLLASSGSYFVFNGKGFDKDKTDKGFKSVLTCGQDSTQKLTSNYNCRIYQSDNSFGKYGSKIKEFSISSAQALQGQIVQVDNSNAMLCIKGSNSCLKINLVSMDVSDYTLSDLAISNVELFKTRVVFVRPDKTINVASNITVNSGTPTLIAAGDNLLINDGNSLKVYDEYFTLINEYPEINFSDYVKTSSNMIYFNNKVNKHLYKVVGGQLQDLTTGLTISTPITSKLAVYSKNNVDYIVGCGNQMCYRIDTSNEKLYKSNTIITGEVPADSLMFPVDRGTGKTEFILFNDKIQ